jgi:RND family efflux transporter MFP subunit
MKLLALIPVLLMAGAGLAGTLWMHGNRATDKPRPWSAVPGRIAANGVVEGSRPEVALRPEVAGNINAIPFRENAIVQAGDLLVELRNEPQKCQVDLARAAVAQARAEYQQCKSESDRTQKLGVAVVSRERFEGDHFKAQKALAQLEEAEARLRLAQAEFAKTRLTAPFAGRVLRVFAETGEQAGPNTAQPVLLLSDDSRRRVRAFIEELDAHRVQIGQRAEIACDGLPGRVFSGRIAVVLPRMGKRSLSTDAPEEYKDVYSREVLIDLENGLDLALNVRVRVTIETVEGQP